MNYSSKLGVIATAIVVGTMMSGCSTIIKGTSQSIAISTPPVTGANCTLTSSQGSWSVSTPGAVTVERSKEDIQARCAKEGYEDAVAMIPSNFEGWTVGNLVFGGLIGVGVDAATGAMNQYPKAFQIPMQASAPTAASMATPVAAAPATGAVSSTPVADDKPAKPARKAKPAAAAATAAAAAPAETH
jgi:hypothetical protein